uniref:Uncharacterized protein n=1 Tax=Megaselia scalaris TaxID=36166 RepID=T1GA98_MEGSC
MLSRQIYSKFSLRLHRSQFSLNLEEKYFLPTARGIETFVAQDISYVDPAFLKVRVNSIHTGTGEVVGQKTSKGDQLICKKNYLPFVRLNL